MSLEFSNNNHTSQKADSSMIMINRIKKNNQQDTMIREEQYEEISEDEQYQSPSKKDYNKYIEAYRENEYGRSNNNFGGDLSTTGNAFDTHSNPNFNYS